MRIWRLRKIEKYGGLDAGLYLSPIPAKIPEASLIAELERLKAMKAELAIELDKCCAYVEDLKFNRGSIEGILDTIKYAPATMSPKG